MCKENCECPRGGSNHSTQNWSLEPPEPYQAQEVCDPQRPSQTGSHVSLYRAQLVDLARRATVALDGFWRAALEDDGDIALVSSSSPYYVAGLPHALLSPSGSVAFKLGLALLLLMVCAATLGLLRSRYDHRRETQARLARSGPPAPVTAQRKEPTTRSRLSTLVDLARLADWGWRILEHLTEGM